QHQALDSMDPAFVPDTYMADILSLFPFLPEVSQSDRLLVSQKRRFGVLTGMSKEIAQRASLNPELYERLKDVFTKELAGLRGEDEVKDPLEVKTKGRPKNSRFVSSVESKKVDRLLGVEDAVRKATIRVPVVGGESRVEWQEFRS